jgi:hypothetical protein
MSHSHSKAARAAFGSPRLERGRADGRPMGASLGPQGPSISGGCQMRVGKSSAAPAAFA